MEEQIKCKLNREKEIITKINEIEKTSTIQKLNETKSLISAEIN